MINHFASRAAAEAHLISKGFTRMAKSSAIWVSADGYIDARICSDPHRGTYIQYRA